MVYPAEEKAHVQGRQSGFSGSLPSGRSCRDKIGTMGGFMSQSTSRIWLAIGLAGMAVSLAGPASKELLAQQSPSSSLRLYVMDCGNLGGDNPLAMAAYLVVHPK